MRVNLKKSGEKLLSGVLIEERTYVRAAALLKKLGYDFS